MEFLKTFLEGSVDHAIYRDYIVNRHFKNILFTVVWPVVRVETSFLSVPPVLLTLCMAAVSWH